MARRRRAVLGRLVESTGVARRFIGNEFADEHVVGLQLQIT
jgi:S-adenosylmethionine:diacylglycerol 3-amino-3-carboxypropyl transferase